VIAARGDGRHRAPAGACRHPPRGQAQRLVVKDKYGPLREGELDRAWRWGEELARKVAA
jgi:hypothetical protein